MFKTFCRVATTNALPQDEQGEDVVYESNFERLHAQALEEIVLFKDMGMGDLIEDGLASHSVLVSRLNKMFTHFLTKDWVPKTKKKLDEEREKLKLENAVLGMPEAHEPDALKKVREAVVKKVEKVH